MALRCVALRGVLWVWEIIIGDMRSKNIQPFIYLVVFRVEYGHGMACTALVAVESIRPVPGLYN